MAYYEALKVRSFIGENVIIGLVDGTFMEGILHTDLINEDWKEDGEKESLGLQVAGHLVEIFMDTIKFIARKNDIVYAEKAISA